MEMGLRKNEGKTKIIKVEAKFEREEQRNKGISVWRGGNNNNKTVNNKK